MLRQRAVRRNPAEITDGGLERNAIISETSVGDGFNAEFAEYYRQTIRIGRRFRFKHGIIGNSGRKIIP